MSPSFGVDTKFIPGFDGVQKSPAELTIQSTHDKITLSIIKENGMHVSSCPITKNKLKNIVKDDFWVLKDRDF